MSAPFGSLLLVVGLGLLPALAQERRPTPPRPGEDGPPPPRDGREPPPPREGREPRPPREGRKGRGYSLEQATSDRAQLHTIAFSGLAFLTGDVGASTFLPPGKVSDFFGFQYLRDIDAAGKGHNPMFLDRIAGNVMRLLTASQREAFRGAAVEEAALMDALARKRLPLVAAFHRALDGPVPPDSQGLDRAAVQAATADLFALDARLAWHRARVYGDLVRSLDEDQRRTLAGWTFGDFRSWPAMDREAVRELRPRFATKLEGVAYMTLASEFFSWFAGSVEADTYFCPERHGTYFGGFYLKDLPAMGQRDYDISTALTGDQGEAFLDALTPVQRQRMADLVEAQRPALAGLVQVRRDIATRLRGFLRGQGPAEPDLVALGRRYGTLDGELAWRYATAFLEIHRTLTPDQEARLTALRGQPSRESGTAFLYSDRIPMPALPEASSFLGRKGGRP